MIGDPGHFCRKFASISYWIPVEATLFGATAITPRSKIIIERASMCRALQLLTCLMGLSLLAGCTVAEPSFRPDLGGYGMIHEETEPTVVTQRAAGDERPSKS